MRIITAHVCVRLECRLTSNAAGVHAGVRVVDAVLVELLEQYPHIFKAGVETLSVERQNGMRCVTDNHDSGAVMVGPALDADQWQVRIEIELFAQGLGVDEFGADSREVLVEECVQILVRIFQRCVMRRGREERACKRLVSRWQGDEHELAPGPNVEMVGRDAEISLRRRRDPELAP